VNEGSAHSTRGGMPLALAGLIINALMAIVKLLAGIAGHSHALIADSVESLTDVAGSLVVWGGLRIAAKPPDKDHPYGHGKAEALATLVVAMTLVGAGASVAVSSVRAILAPTLGPQPFTLWVLLVVVVIKESMYQIGRRLSAQSGSGAVLADALHHRSDAITSVAAAIGIGVALWGGAGYEIADGIAALFASGIILFNAGRLARAPVNELMDRKSPEIIAQIRVIAREVAGVKGIEKVHTRKSGTRYLVDMHVEVDPQMSVRDAHEVSHRVKDALRQRMPRVLDVLVHIEPFNEQE
jgi:cation diffusion facilitator family transporter